MPKLDEVIELFERFGFPEEYIRSALAMGDSAFNAFEGLKLTLQIRWGELCQELSVAEQRELRPIYDRIQNITMTSRTVKPNKEDQYGIFSQRLFDHMEKNGREAFELTREHIRRFKRTGQLNKAVEARVRALGFFSPDEEI